jgi:hypothetical protein
MHFCSFKPPSLWHFVTAMLRSKHTQWAFTMSLPCGSRVHTAAGPELAGGSAQMCSGLQPDSADMLCLAQLWVVESRAVFGVPPAFCALFPSP